MSGAYRAFVTTLAERGLQKGKGWLCPAHEDTSPSLSITEGRDGRVLVKCHTGCTFQEILAALSLELADLFEPNTKDWDRVMTKTYDYTDEHGNLLFQVCREEPKRFWQRRPDGNDGWINNIKGVTRVPYRLPEFLKHPDAVVFITEGEKDADRLAAAGLIATTNAMGAGKWRRSYNRHFRGREVVILPDNDAPGRSQADDVARSLSGVARSVKVVELPGLPDKGDVSDWLNDGHSADDLVELVESAAPYKVAGHRPTEAPPNLKVIDIGKGRKQRRRSNTDSFDGESPNAGTPNEERESLAKKLIRMVLGEDVVLFHDERGEPYASIAVPGGRRIMALAAKDFTRWVSRLAWVKLDRAATSEAIAAARQTLGGVARFDGEQHRLHVRHARHDGAIWIDLDGQRAISVRPGRWEIVAMPPILFRSFPHQRMMPDPIPGGDAEELLRFTNIKDRTDQLMLLCYLVAAMVPEIPIAALILHGVQGSAKTTLLKIIKRLIDPSAVEVRGGVRDLTEFALAAFQNRALFYDNLTSLPEWQSDALCRAVSGEGWSKRTLYCDEDMTVLEYQGVIGLAGINLVADRPDLLDRSVILQLDPVSPEHRRNEQDFWREFESARPRILGGLLDALARAMCVVPGLWPRRLPRMADFARWGAAAALGLRREPVDFLSAYDGNVVRQNEAVLAENPVSQAILAFMEERGEWDGPPAELLRLLDEIGEQRHLDKKSAAWPKSANWLTRRINEVVPTLLALGIEVKVERDPARRGIRLLRVEEGKAHVAAAS